MNRFVKVAALILIVAAGVYIYEAVMGPVSTTSPESAVATKKVPPVTPSAREPVSFSKTPRERTLRTLDRSLPLPVRPPVLEDLINKQGGSDFPILLPLEVVASLQATEQYALRLKITEHGYTAVMTYPNMDVVITGTRIVFRRKAAFEAEIAEIQAERDRALKTDPNNPDATTASGPPEPRIREPYTKRFEEAAEGQGGTLSFGRFGADYQVEFYCREDFILKDVNCIDETGARTFVQTLEEANVLNLR